MNTYKMGYCHIPPKICIACEKSGVDLVYCAMDVDCPRQMGTDHYLFFMTMNIIKCCMQNNNSDFITMAPVVACHAIGLL